MRDDFSEAREGMVKTQIAARGVKDARVLEAMRKVPRHLFVPEDVKAYAYNDEPLPIGDGQTISQPYIVAYMTEVLEFRGVERVLEVGTGSGYQAAILAEVAREVHTVEFVESLSFRAQATLRNLGYANIRFKVGDGSHGWEEECPFDAILVTAAPSSVPRPLREQLRIGGRMVIPVGNDDQELILIRREPKSYKETKLISVRFVPLVSFH